MLEQPILCLRNVLERQVLLNVSLLSEVLPHGFAELEMLYHGMVFLLVELQSQQALFSNDQGFHRTIFRVHKAASSAVFVVQRLNVCKSFRLLIQCHLWCNLHPESSGLANLH